MEELKWIWTIEMPLPFFFFLNYLCFVILDHSKTNFTFKEIFSPKDEIPNTQDFEGSGIKVSSWTYFDAHIYFGYVHKELQNIKWYTRHCSHHFK